MYVHAENTRSKNEKATEIMFCEYNENQGVRVYRENVTSPKRQISGCVNVEP